MIQRTYIQSAEVFLVNPASVNPGQNNFANASEMNIPLFAGSIKIPWKFKTDEVEFLGTNGSFTQVLGMEPVEMEMTVNSWSMDFIEAMIGRDESNRPYAKSVTFLIRGILTEQGTNKREEVQVITFGQMIEGDLLALEAGNAQKTDYTFSLQNLSMKHKGRSQTYNLAG